MMNVRNIWDNLEPTVLIVGFLFGKLEEKVKRSGLPWAEQ